MGCCPKPTDGVEHEYDRPHMSPVEDRKCRDVSWLLVFLIATAGSGYMSYLAYEEGDLRVLQYGISSGSGLCGVGTNLEFPKTMYCLNGTWGLGEDGIVAVCARKCPTNGNEVVEAFNEKKQEFLAATKRSELFWNPVTLKTLCVAPSVSVMNRCLYDFSWERSGDDTDSRPPTDTYYNSSLGGNEGNDQLGQSAQMFLNGYNDVERTWYICLSCGIGGGLLLSFLWLQGLKYSATTITWSSLILSFVCLVSLDVYLAVQAGWITADVDQLRQGNYGDNQRTAMDSDYVEYYGYLCIIASTLTVVALLIVFALRRAIGLSIQLVKEAADVIRTVPQIIALPAVPVIFYVCIFIYFVVFSVYLASCGEVRDGNLEWDQELRYAMIFHTGYVLWCFFFVAALHSIVMAGIVSAYYWTRDKRQLRRPVKRSIARTLKYSAGSAALGSLVLTIVRMVKWYLVWLSEKFKRAAEYTPNNKLVAHAVACFRCCIFCVEKFIQYLTKNAYILIAVDGQSFCYATGQAWALVMSNVGRMSALNMVSSYLFFISKLGIATLCAIAVSAWINAHEDSLGCSSSYAPMIVTWIVGYFIAWLFFELTDFCLDTLMVSFCLDDVRNRHSGNYYASPRLLAFLSRSSRSKGNNAATRCCVPYRRSNKKGTDPDSENA